MKILLCWFSATGNTVAIAEAIGRRLSELGAEVDPLDITHTSNRERHLDLTAYAAAVFGAPIHSARAPRLVREWWETLDGQGKKCASFFTYGGFYVHPSHHTAREILSRRNFKLVASADFLGAHTYNLGGWQAMEGRPDASDFSAAAEFAEKIFGRFNGKDPAVVAELDTGLFTETELDNMEKVRYKAVTKLPTRDGAECQLCLLCEKQCPVGAMDAQTGEADPNLCIVCLRCFKNCPDQALKINDLAPFFRLKMEKDGETAATLQSKKSKLYL